jgi:hypothetical protein
MATIRASWTVENYDGYLVNIHFCFMATAQSINTCVYDYVDGSMRAFKQIKLDAVTDYKHFYKFCMFMSTTRTVTLYENS